MFDSNAESKGIVLYNVLGDFTGKIIINVDSIALSASTTLVNHEWYDPVASTMYTGNDIIQYITNGTFTSPVTYGAATTFAVGDIGLSGGWIFYDDAIGYDFDADTIIQTDEKDLLDGVNDGTLSGDRYLEISPDVWSGVAPDPTSIWGTGNHAIDSSVLVYYDTYTSDKLTTVALLSMGKGEAGTTAISTYYGDTVAISANLCIDYVNGSLIDWFLPSLGELHVAFKVLCYPADPTTGYYSTSSVVSEYLYRFRRSDSNFFMLCN